MSMEKFQMQLLEEELEFLRWFYSDITRSLKCDMFAYHCDYEFRTGRQVPERYKNDC